MLSALRPASRRALSASVHRNASTLVLAEHSDGLLSQATLSAVTAATQIGGPVTVLVCGSDTDAVSSQAAAVEGVSSVLQAADACLDHGVAENATALLEAAQAAHSFSHIVACATNEGKNIIPRLAAKLDIAALTGVTEVQSETTFVRPMYAGNAMATVEVSDGGAVAMTVQPTTFEKAAQTGGSASVETFAAPGDAGKAAWLSDEVAKSDRPELSAAGAVVAGGRGMKNGENFGMLYDLADKMDAAVGASRAAVDAGFVPNELQVGQTGKVVAPDLYIAVGISGAIQHLAGMKDSKTIVCINKDAEAPIFQVSDYGLEADLFKAVPELNEKL